MAWTTPRTWVTAEVVTAAQLNAHVRDNENFLADFHGARMWQSAALSQTDNGASELITWDSEDYDTDAFGVPTSDWFVVPTGFGGYYTVATVVTFAANATGRRELKIMKNETYATRTPNGVGTVLQSFRNEGMVGGQTHSDGLMWQGPLIAGDHITIEAFQNSGGNLAFTVGKDTLSTHIHYLGT